MADKAMDNNQVTIVGTVDSEFTYSHEVFGEGFYMLEVVVNRLSHMEDRIPSSPTNANSRTNTERIRRFLLSSCLL